MEDSAQAVIRIVADRLAVARECIRGDQRLIEDLGADSLDLVELVMTLEERFGTAVEDEILDQLSTVRDLIRLLVPRRQETSD